MRIYLSALSHYASKLSEAESSYGYSRNTYLLSVLSVRLLGEIVGFQAIQDTVSIHWQTPIIKIFYAYYLECTFLGQAISGKKGDWDR